MSIIAAIIGCGENSPGKGAWHSVGYAHAWAYQRCPEVRIISAADRIKKNIDDFTNEFYGIKGYQDYKEMLQAEHPDIVSICAFPRYREEMVNEAINARVKAIWIEKPFAPELGTARRMMEKAKQGNVRLFLNHQRRYGKPFEWLRDAVKEKRIGELASFDVQTADANIMDFGSHLIDAALFCIGERRPVNVYSGIDVTSINKKHDLSFPEHIIASVHFNDGCRMTFEGGEPNSDYMPILRAQGTDGFAEIYLNIPSGANSIFRALYKGEKEVFNPSTDEHFHSGDDPALYISRAAQDIVQAMNTDKPTRIDISEAYRGLEIMIGILEAGRLNSKIEFPVLQEAFPLDVQ